jgi:hypothetical protein
MPTNKLVPTDYELVEFRPVPGAEDEWAGFQFVDHSRLWDWLGVLPVGLWLVLNLLVIGMVAVG